MSSPNDQGAAPHVVRAYVPSVITKELALASIGGRRRFRVSSNFLPLMGFEPGRRHTVDVAPGLGGMVLALGDAPNSIQVYERRYKRRRSNPFETVIEVANQRLLDAAIPAYTERVHLTMRQGRLEVRPLTNRTFAIRRSMRGRTELAAMVAMTAGVDVHCLSACGFHIEAVLEYRPHEARDQLDLTESGALNVLANSRPRVVFNEDITRVDWDRVKREMAGGPPIAALHISLQCDDFSAAKGQALKRAAVDDLSTTRDLVYDALRMVETVRPASVVVENVPAFGSAAEGDLLRVKLQRWGYHVTDAVMSAPDYGGLTKRERYYLVASVWPGFEMPAQSAASGCAWAAIEPLLWECRDVTHTSSVRDGIEQGRIRLLRPGEPVAPTILKSQARQAKDSLYIATGDGRYLLPTLQVLRRLQGIPDDFRTDSGTGALAAEIVGQSIDVPMHRALTQALHDHLAHNVGARSVVGLVGRLEPRKSAAQGDGARP